MARGYAHSIRMVTSAKQSLRAKNYKGENAHNYKFEAKMNIQIKIDFLFYEHPWSLETANSLLFCGLDSSDNSPKSMYNADSYREA